MRRAAIVLICAMWPSAAWAEDTEQAKALFAAGAAAYDQHDYAGAIRAFEGAQKAAARPQIEFSLAQAHRRAFYVDGNADHQKAAIDLFRDYVKQVPSGGRHEDAMRALQELGALSPQRDATSVSINSSGTPGARVSLDGEPSLAAPLIEPTRAGKHHAVISADGFVSEERDIMAVEGQIVALDVPLKEKQARVVLTAPSGATVSVDGRAVGDMPVAPIDLPSGTHVLTLTKNGHDAYSHEIELGRGEQRRVDAPLPVTKQRVIAEALLVTSAVTVVAAASFAVIAATYLAQAEAILTKKGQQNIDINDYNAYNDARSNRTTWLDTAAASFAGAGVLAVTGLVLFVFDRPSAPSPSEERKTKPTEHKAVPMYLAFTPLLSPTMLGASAQLRF